MVGVHGEGLRRLVREMKVEFSDHALVETDNDNLTLEDLRTVLLHGAIQAKHEDDLRGVRYVIRGAVDDEDVDVVCCLKSGTLWIISL